MNAPVIARLAVSALFLLCAGAVARAEDMPVIKVEMRDGVILPAIIEVPANTRFKLEISNTGQSPVEFESLELKREKALAAVRPPRSCSARSMRAATTCSTISIRRRRPSWWPSEWTSGRIHSRRCLAGPGVPAPGRTRALDAGLARLGDWLRAHAGSIRAVQWIVVAVYILLVAVPAFLPLPDNAQHIWTNLTLAAQFAFWGIWWPFVLVSMVLVGRVWCGVFCPEGALSEIASRWSRGYAVPRWITWSGWPFIAFAGTTVYGQMTSVYGYPKPALAVLGGSTLAAIVVGLLYGRNKRVWCRYLCPVNGVFAVLSKLAPLSFQVDHAAWAASPKPARGTESFNCAPLVPVKTMRGRGRLPHVRALLQSPGRGAPRPALAQPRDRPRSGR